MIYIKTSDFYFDLPEELIAQTPIAQRDTSRLLKMDRATGAIAHHRFYELPEFLRPGDALVLNDSRVLPARLIGALVPGGQAAELLLLTERGDGQWECLVRPGKRLREGARVSFGGGKLMARVTQQLESGNRLVRFCHQGIFLELLSELGTMPLPPYIKAELKDAARYQTVYSREMGSAAAPTAGLHFTEELLEKIAAMGVSLCYVTLHVGIGTFRPVKAEKLSEHEMHSEYCTLGEETAATINRTRELGGRVICIGTTSCRTIESFAAEDGRVSAGSRWTDIFLYPGRRFKVTDGLLTNFHLPESTLIMLVSAFSSRERLLHAYEEAVHARYRFFSFGDAMLIL